MEVRHPTVPLKYLNLPLLPRCPPNPINTWRPPQYCCIQHSPILSPLLPPTRFQQGSPSSGVPEDVTRGLCIGGTCQQLLQWSFIAAGSVPPPATAWPALTPPPPPLHSARCQPIGLNRPQQPHQPRRGARAGPILRQRRAVTCQRYIWAANIYCLLRVPRSILILRPGELTNFLHYHSFQKPSLSGRGG